MPVKYGEVGLIPIADSSFLERKWGGKMVCTCLSRARLLDAPPTMKPHENCTEAGNSTSPLVPVRFEFVDPSARTVCVAGSFNHWQPATRTLKRARGGHWRKETALAPGTYEYKLVVDGQWMTDPLAMYYVPNPFGGLNSVIKVARSGEVAHRLMKKVLRKKAGKQKSHPVNTLTPGAIA